MTLPWDARQDAAIAIARRRAAALYALASGAQPDDEAKWLQDIAARQAPMRGLNLESVPPAWRGACLWAGVPLALAGENTWQDCLPDPQLDRPHLSEAGELRLPATPESLQACDGVRLKALRNWLGQVFGLRLQAAPGLLFFLWPQQAVLISLHDCPLHGFLHGPTRGERHVLALPPGGDVRICFRNALDA